MVGGIVAFGIQYYGNTDMLRRTAKLETVLEYTKTEDSITPFAARYIAAISDNGDLKTAQRELRIQLANEMERAEKLKNVFASAEPSIELYLDALSMFSDSIDNATDATKMRNWIERLGHVVDTRIALEKTLLSAAGA